MTRNFRVGLVLDYYLGNSDKPTGVEEVDFGLQGGAFAEFAFDHWRFDARALQSLSGDAGGLQINFGVAYGTRSTAIGASSSGPTRLGTTTTR